jgi:periplasmic divalent cation tolerance protein
MRSRRAVPNRKSGFVQVLTTVSSRQAAQRIADQLVRERLAACVQIVGPITSTYRWKGRVETAREWLCLVKTGKNLYRRVESAIRGVHPYEVPEIVALPVVAGSRAYLGWLDRELQSLGRS